MQRAKVTAKGQITIPKAVREGLGLKPGDKVEFVKDDGTFAIRKVFNPEGLLKYRGYLKHLSGRRTDEIIEEMRGS